MNRKKWSLAAALSLPMLLVAGLLLAGQTLFPAAALAQAESGITSPAPGSTIDGVVSIEGTAVTESFQRYELYYKPGDAGDQAYIYVDGGEQPVIDGQLGVWDTTTLEPGIYDLRLRVVQVDGNYSEHFASNLTVNQEEAAPAETPEEAATPITATATLTPTETVTDTETAEPTAVISPTATATDTTVVSPTATVTPTLPVETEEPSDLPADAAQILAESNVNVRAGPGTNYPIISALQTGQTAPITGQNAAGDWWQIEIFGASGWVLGSLVTAQNTGDVPVVEAPAPPPTPVPTVTPVVADEGVAVETVTEEGTAEVVAVEGTALTSFTAGGPVTVTLAGDDADPDALGAFLRTLLAAFGPNNTVVTATVGALPDDLPLDLTVPATATVIGGVVRTGEFGGNQIYLATEETADDLVATLRQQLLDEGFTAPPQESTGAGQVFLSTDQFALPVLLCGADDEIVVSLGTVLVAGEAEVVSLSTNPTSSFGGPCGEDAGAGGSAVFDVLPSLAPPAQAQVRGSGSGSSSGSDGFSISAEAEIETALTAAELATHYEAQLEDAGWVRLDDSSTDALAWSAWSFSDDDDNEWTATFYIVRQASEADGYLATLRAETGQ